MNAPPINMEVVVKMVEGNWSLRCHLPMVEVVVLEFASSSWIVGLAHPVQPELMWTTP